MGSVGDTAPRAHAPAANLHLQIQHVEARDAVRAHVASRASHALVAAAAEGQRALPRQDHHPHRRVLPCIGKAQRHLHHCTAQAGWMATARCAEPAKGAEACSMATTRHDASRQAVAARLPHLCVG